MGRHHNVISISWVIAILVLVEAMELEGSSMNTHTTDYTKRMHVVKPRYRTFTDGYGAGSGGGFGFGMGGSEGAWPGPAGGYDKGGGGYGNGIGHGGGYGSGGGYGAGEGGWKGNGGNGYAGGGGGGGYGPGRAKRLVLD